MGSSLPNIFRRTFQFLACLSFLLLVFPSTAWAQSYIFGRADFPVGPGPETMTASIAVGDFNGDGVQDFAFVNEADNTVSILLGKPDGTFAPQVSYPTGVSPFAIAAADFNGDGNLDLAITNGDCYLIVDYGLVCTGTTVSILLGNGDGTLSTKIRLLYGERSYLGGCGRFQRRRQARFGGRERRRQHVVSVAREWGWDIPEPSGLSDSFKPGIGDCR